MSGKSARGGNLCNCTVRNNISCPFKIAFRSWIGEDIDKLSLLHHKK